MKKILLFLLTFLACTYSAQAEDWLYLLGDFNRWSNNETYLFKYHNGSYTLLVEDGSALKNKSFKFGNNYGTAVWYGADNTGIKTPYKVYPKTSNSNNMSFGDISDAVIFNVYNYQSGIQFDCAITSADLYIRGLYGNWDANAATQFDRAGYIYTKTVTLSGATECKIADNSYNTEYGLSTAITKVGTYDLTYAGGQAGFNLPDGTYDLTFDFSTLKLTVAAHSETPTYPTSLYLYPDGKEIPAVEGKEGVYSVAGLTKSEIASFRFNTKSDNSGTAYGTTTGADVAITLGDNIDMKEGGGNRWTLTPEFDGTYDIEIDLSTMKFFVTQSTVTYPDVMYYYNGAKPCTVTLANIGDGVYSADIEVAAGESFRFYTAPEATDNLTSYGAETAGQALTLGSDITIVNNTTNKWSIAEAGTYTFTVSLKHHSLNVVKKSVTPDPEFTKYYLRGDINGWGTSEDWELKTTDGLTYTLNNVTLVSGQQFKIGQAGDENWVGYGYSSTDGELSIYPDGTGYKIYKDNSGNLKFDYVYDRLVNITFTLASIDSNEATLKVVYVEGAEITYPTLYLRGNFSGEYWATNDAYKFTQSGDVYTLTVNGNDVKNNEWVIATDGYTYNFGVSEAITVTEGTKLSWNKNKGAQAGFGELEDAKYVLEYTYSTQTLKVTKQGAVVTYPDLWLRGGFNNWGNDGEAANTAYKFTCTDGVYTLTVEAGKLSNKEFKIGSSETRGDWNIGFGGKDANVTAKIGEAFTVYNVVRGKNIYIAENSYKFDIKFVPDFANNTGELTISINNPSGIEDVEISNEAPVEFYNLQGVRVDGELTPGLYIRRQGNSASKVLIR